MNLFVFSLTTCESSEKKHWFFSLLKIFLWTSKEPKAPNMEFVSFQNNFLL